MKRTTAMLVSLITILALTSCGLVSSKGPEIVPGLENVVLEKPTIASSVNGGYSGDRAVDGIWEGSSSRWVTADGAEIPHLLEIDLQDSYVLYSAEIWSGLEGQDGRYSVSDAKLQYWFDDEWVDVPGGSIGENEKEHVVLTFTETVTTDKVRFYSERMRSGDGHALRIREILVYGVLKNN